MPENTPARSSTRLWSEEVGIAQAEEPPKTKKDPAYEWSNGKVMEEGDGPYANPVLP